MKDEIDKNSKSKIIMVPTKTLKTEKCCENVGLGSCLEVVEQKPEEDKSTREDNWQPAIEISLQNIQDTPFYRNLKPYMDVTQEGLELKPTYWPSYEPNFKCDHVLDFVVQGLRSN